MEGMKYNLLAELENLIEDQPVRRLARYPVQDLLLRALHPIYYPILIGVESMAQVGHFRHQKDYLGTSPSRLYRSLS